MKSGRYIKGILHRKHAVMQSDWKYTLRPNMEVGLHFAIELELAAWEQMRNKACCKVTWHFTTPQAHPKLISHSSKFEESGR